MSTREIAYGIVSRLNESQLKEFIAAFGQNDDVNHTDYTVEKELTEAEIEERMADLRELEEMTREIPDFDYEKAKDEYMEEKYGKL